MTKFTPTIPADARKMLARARRYDRMAADAADAAAAAAAELKALEDAADAAAAAVLKSAGVSYTGGNRSAHYLRWALRNHKDDVAAVPAKLLEAAADADAAARAAAARADGKRLGYEAEGYRYGAAALRKAALDLAIAANAPALQAAPAHYKKIGEHLNAVVEALGFEGIPARDGGVAYAHIYYDGCSWRRSAHVVAYDGAHSVKLYYSCDDGGRIDFDRHTLADAGNVPTPAQVRRAARLALEAPEKKRKALAAYTAAVNKLTDPLWMLPSVREDLERVR